MQQTTQAQQRVAQLQTDDLTDTAQSSVLRVMKIAGFILISFGIYAIIISPLIKSGLI